MKLGIVFEARREGYTPEQLYSCMTVGELKELLEDYNDETWVVISHDNGYTFGSLEWKEEVTIDDDERI